MGCWVGGSARPIAGTATTWAPSHRDTEGQPEGSRHHRDDLRRRAVEGADNGTERVVNSRSGARLLALGEPVAREARGYASNLDRRVFGLGGRRFGSMIQIAQDMVGEAHCAGCQQTSEQAKNGAARHVATAHRR